VIHGSGICKSYRTGSVDARVLDNLHLEVQEAECVFLVGPSGSGKSTLLSILGCILSPDSGVLRVLGDDVTQLNKRQKARFRREQIGFVFQRFHLFRGLKAWENVRIALDLLGWSARRARRESLNLLESVGLSDKAFNHVHQLSMGQRQRVALARALAGDPQLILADEPTAALDAESGLNAMQLLRRLATDRQKTVLVVTHDSRIFPFADRILHLQDRHIAQVETAKGLSEGAGAG
jgi:putative ABC transport system ATP-binding protein